MPPTICEKCGKPFCTNRTYRHQDCAQPEHLIGSGLEYEDLCHGHTPKADEACKTCGKVMAVTGKSYPIEVWETLCRFPEGSGHSPKADDGWTEAYEAGVRDALEKLSMLHRSCSDCSFGQECLCTPENVAKTKAWEAISSLLKK